MEMSVISATAKQTRQKPGLGRCQGQSEDVPRGLARPGFATGGRTPGEKAFSDRAWQSAREPPGGLSLLWLWMQYSSRDVDPGLPCWARLLAKARRAGSPRPWLHGSPPTRGGGGGILVRRERHLGVLLVLWLGGGKAARNRCCITRIRSQVFLWSFFIDSKLITYIYMCSIYTDMTSMATCHDVLWTEFAWTVDLKL